MKIILIYFLRIEDQGAWFLRIMTDYLIIKVMYSSKFVENRVSQMKELFDSINSKGLIKDSNLPKINILKNRMSGGGLWVMAATIDHILYLVWDMRFLVQE